MRSKHTMTALCPFGLDGIEVEIAFTFRKGAPEQGPSYASGGQPADPDEVELIYVKPIKHTLDDLMSCMLSRWAEDYLADEGFSEALEQAASDYESAREYADELRRDR